MLNILQGDQYAIPISLTIGEGDSERPLVPDDVDDLEIVVGEFSKTYLTDGVTFDETNNLWLYNLAQSDSFSMYSTVPIVARPVINGEIFGIDLGEAKIKSVLTRRML